MIAGLELPSEGQIVINGRDVTYEEPRHRGHRHGVSGLWALSAHVGLRNIEFPLKIRKVAPEQRRRTIEETAEKSASWTS